MAVSSLLLLALLAIIIDLVTANDVPLERATKTMKFLALATSMLIGAGEMDGDDDDNNTEADPRLGTRVRRRKRQFVSRIFNEHGPLYTRRAYRMNADAFWKLEKILRPRMIKKRLAKISQHRSHDGARNGRITPAIRLSAALRYFAGGRAYDIAICHGISHIREGKM